MRLCPREHALYSLGIRSGVEQEPLTLGFLFHLGLEVFFKSIQAHQESIGWNPPLTEKEMDHFCFGNLAEAERAAWDTLDPIREEPGYAKTYAMVEKLLVNYFEKWRGRDYWRIVAVEETLEYVDPEFEYTARLDLIIEELFGDTRALGTWIVEHKTAGTITEDLLMNYAMDLQILGQKWLFETCVDTSQLPPFRGVIVDIITTRHKVPRTERVVVNPSHYHTDAFEDSQRRWSRLATAFAAEGWPKALGNCAGAARFFKTCPYYTLCEGRPEHTVADWREELETVGPPHGFSDIYAEDP